MSTKLDDRERFERWWHSEGYQFDARYMSAIQHAWLIWRASLADGRGSRDNTNHPDR